MKAITIIIILALASCAPIPPGTWNPLDTPETYIVRPEAMGHFGPHSEYYPR